MTGEQRERLLELAVSGVELETAMEALGICELDLQLWLLSDEDFDISLALAQGMRSEFARALFEELASDQSGFTD
jgi:hypothetical protein